MTFILETIGRRRRLVPLPFPAALLMGKGTETVKKLAFGLFPDMLDMTEDQVKLLQIDNVVSQAAAAEGRTLQGLGLRPESFEAYVPGYLSRFRKTGQFAAYSG